jgi:hypothetical protein
MLAEAPYRLNGFMSGRRFKAISSSLTFGDGSHVGGSNKFAQEIVKDKYRNDNMEGSYCLGGTVTPDETMKRWLHRQTCPGWTCCPRKPWKFGRERHTVAGSNFVIFAFETQMGKDRPIGLTKRFEGELCSTVLLLIAALAKNGLWANAQIKKRCYWPKFIEQPKIAELMEGYKVGDWGVRKGELLQKPIFIVFQTPNRVGKREQVD